MIFSSYLARGALVSAQEVSGSLRPRLRGEKGRRFPIRSRCGRVLRHLPPHYTNLRSRSNSRRLRKHNRSRSSGATIHVVDGPDIENGTVLFDAGKIIAVGGKVAIPKNAKQIDAAGQHVYPGLIESMSDIGLREINAVTETADHTEFGDRNPNAKSWVAVNPDSELIPVARANGVLLAMTAPRGNWLRGQTSVIQLDGWSAADMTLKSPAGLYVNWRAMHPTDDDPKKQITKREEKLSEFDALLDEARRYRAGRQLRPEATPTDVRLESLFSVLDGKLPIIAEANEQAVIESAVTYAQSQQLSLIIYGGYDAEQWPTYCASTTCQSSSDRSTACPAVATIRTTHLTPWLSD